MTERYSGFVVTLAEPMRDDDAQAVINAISMIKNVVSVQPLDGGFDHITAYERARHDLWMKLIDIVKERKPVS